MKTYYTNEVAIVPTDQSVGNCKLSLYDTVNFHSKNV